MIIITFLKFEKPLRLLMLKKNILGQRDIIRKGLIRILGDGKCINFSMIFRSMLINKFRLNKAIYNSQANGSDFIDNNKK